MIYPFICSTNTYWETAMCQVLSQMLGTLERSSSHCRGLGCAHSPVRLSSHLTNRIISLWLKFRTSPKIFRCLSFLIILSLALAKSIWFADRSCFSTLRSFLHHFCVILLSSYEMTPSVRAPYSLIFSCLFMSSWKGIRDWCPQAFANGIIAAQLDLIYYSLIRALASQRYICKMGTRGYRISPVKLCPSWGWAHWLRADLAHFTSMSQRLHLGTEAAEMKKVRARTGLTHSWHHCSPYFLEPHTSWTKAVLIAMSSSSTPCAALELCLVLLGAQGKRSLSREWCGRVDTPTGVHQAPEQSA